MRPGIDTAGPGDKSAAHPFRDDLATAIVGNNPSEADSAFFRVGDAILGHGGQTVLDVAGFVPGLNIVTEGGQSLYHTAHAMNDAREGNAEAAVVEGGEAALHG